MRRVDPWSVVKVSALFYLAMSCVALVAGTILWLGATATGVRGNVETFVADLIASKDFRLSGPNLLRLGAISSATLVVLGTGANLVMITLYNLIGDLIGGVTVVVAPVAEVKRDGSAELEVAEAELSGRNGRPGAVPIGRSPDPTGTRRSP